MEGTLVIDFGSRSVKGYIARGQTLLNVATYNWDPIHNEPSQERVDEIVSRIRAQAENVDRGRAIATEAARRSPTLAEKLRQSCGRHGIEYRAISQCLEAELIQRAFSGQLTERVDIVNAGGGSIQIVTSSGRLELIRFGISDLNAEFNLLGRPSERRVEDCRRYLNRHLPKMGVFIYSGGELTYLRAVGATLGASNQCSMLEFRKVSSRLASLELAELEALSPFGHGWMSGAIASNCIVEACLEVSGSDYFHPSDVNIAHGLVGLVAAS